jgi:hypothetical protein
VLARTCRNLHKWSAGEVAAVVGAVGGFPALGSASLPRAHGAAGLLATTGWGERLAALDADALVDSRRPPGRSVGLEVARPSGFAILMRRPTRPSQSPSGRGGARVRGWLRGLLRTRGRRG